MTEFFKLNHTSKKSKARTGTITTAHGVVQTPAFVPVATKATIKAFSPRDLKETGIQLAFVNTYHLVTHPGADIVEKAGGVHEFSKLNIPLMSDSSGFQVFSLANSKKKAHFRGDASMATWGKSELEKSNTPEQPAEIATPFEDNEALMVKISEDGVQFRSVFDGTILEFTPEKSMQYQQQIGADLIMAFDECTDYDVTHEYAKKAMNRTHEWLKRCIANVTSAEWKKTQKHQQYLYGIIQGSVYEDLRKESAQFVCAQDVPGIAIGGVSVGESKEQLREQVRWVSEYLPPQKPVHLLGVGHVEDVLELVLQGIDTFDCVEPTRVARTGKIYQWAMIEDLLSHIGIDGPSGIDILKGIYKADMSLLDENCYCYVCKNFTKAYIHHLLKQKELLAYTLASQHNLYIMEKLMAKIREMINTDQI